MVLTNVFVRRKILGFHKHVNIDRRAQALNHFPQFVDKLLGFRERYVVDQKCAEVINDQGET